MKALGIIIFSFFAFAGLGQSKLIPTDQFSIEGKVKQSVIITLSSLDTFRTKSLPDVVITNHAGVVKNTLTKLKGVSVKDILSTVSIDEENPKLLSEFYFTFVATDNYKVVFPGMKYSIRKLAIMSIS